MSTGLKPHLVVRSVDRRSIGFLIAGASTVAAQRTIDAIRRQPPVAGSDDVAGAWVAGVYSHNARRARQFAETHRIVHAGDDLSLLLQRPEIQAVYVGNLPRHHAETVHQALDAHKHVICEPPLALDSDTAAELELMAEARGLVLAVNYTWRASGLVRRLHELLIDDVIGELLGARIQNTSYLKPEQQTWRLKSQGGGVLLDRGLHDIDTIQFLLHTGVREVFGAATRRLSADEVEDEVVAQLRLAGGLFVQLFESFVLPNTPPIIELFGTEGTLIAQYELSGEKQSAVDLVRTNSRATYAIPSIDPFRVAVARFMGALRGVSPPLATGDDDRRALHIVDALRTSMQVRQPQETRNLKGPDISIHLD